MLSFFAVFIPLNIGLHWYPTWSGHIVYNSIDLLLLLDWYVEYYACHICQILLSEWHTLQQINSRRWLVVKRAKSRTEIRLCQSLLTTGFG